MSFDKILDIKKITAKSLIIGIGLGIFLTFCTLFIFAVIYCYIDVKEWLGSVFALISLTVGAFFGARYTVGKMGEKGFLYGTAVGFALFLVILVISLIFGDGKPSLASLFNLICCVLSGGISGIIRVNKELNKKYIK